MPSIQSSKFKVQGSKFDRDLPIRLHTRPVKYCWSTPDGAVHHASTVLLSRTRAGLRSAFKRFWITNRHVDPDRDSAGDSAICHLPSAISKQEAA